MKIEDITYLQTLSMISNDTVRRTGFFSFCVACSVCGEFEDKEKLREYINKVIDEFGDIFLEAAQVIRAEFDAAEKQMNARNN